MTLPTYEILVDGRGYAGESDAVEPLLPGMHPTGWGHAGPQTCNGIAFGEPVVIVGHRNLATHVARVLRRIGDAKEVVIRRRDD